MEVLNFLQLMVEKNASDLFFSVGAPVNVKIEGITHPLKMPALQPGEVKQMAYSVMNDKQRAEFEARLELNMSISASGMGRFRVNVFMQRGETGMVIRFIKSKIPPMADLGLPPVLEDLVMLKRGLVLVTGAGSGFGRETALLFAREGADIVAVDLHADTAKETARRCQQLGRSAWSRQVDVGDPAAMHALAEWVHQQLGAPDVVVNNAGIGLAGSFFDTTDADWDRLLRVNLGGVILGSRLFGQQMKDAKKPGHIVNVASMAAYTPSRTVAAYATTKAAVRMLSDCLRAELADDGVHVSTICPGFSITNITQTTRFVGRSAADEAEQQQKATRLYQRRNLRPEAIARAILSAVEHRRDDVPVGTEAHGARLLGRLSPTLLRRLARVELGA